MDRIWPCRTGWSPLLAAAIGAVAGLPGCAEKPEPSPLAYSGPTLACADLGLVEPVETMNTGFVLLSKEQSSGRFPAAMAVVRLDQPDPLFADDHHLFVSERNWEVGTLKEEEATYWTTLLKTVPQSRAIMVMDSLSVVTPDVCLTEVIRSMRRLGIELCLIYGPKAAPDESAALAGVMIETATGQYLAYVQAQADVQDYEPPRPDRPEKDLSHRDVNYLAARKFEREVQRCYLALTELDGPPTSTQPSPWRDLREPRMLPENSIPVYILPNQGVGY